MGPRLTQTLAHEPRRFLANVQIAMQLHRRHAFQVRHPEVDGDGPLAQGDFRSLHDRTVADGKVAAAVAAVVRQGLSALSYRNPAGTPALRAFRGNAFLSPPLALEPGFGRLFGGKHLHNLHEGYALSPRFSGAFV